jgi:hypothetical protein
MSLMRVSSCSLRNIQSYAPRDAQLSPPVSPSAPFECPPPNRRSLKTSGMRQRARSRIGAMSLIKIFSATCSFAVALRLKR